MTIGREQELVAFLGRLREGIESQYDPDGMIASIDHYRFRRGKCPPYRLGCAVCGAGEFSSCKRLEEAK